MYERMVGLVLVLLRREIFQCETLEDVERLGRLIKDLEDPGVSDDIALPPALDLLAEHYEF